MAIVTLTNKLEYLKIWMMYICVGLKCNLLHNGVEEGKLEGEEGRMGREEGEGWGEKGRGTRVEGRGVEEWVWGKGGMSNMWVAHEKYF